MEYTVGALARLSGVSPRTIRFYDEAGLLTPARVLENGYRAYGPAEVDRLQEILILRALGMKLSRIAEVLSDPGFDRGAALQNHLIELRDRRAQIDALIGNVEKTLRALKGEIGMKDREKFEGLGERLVRENEEKYGAEIREKYGEEAVERSNTRVRNMKPEDLKRAEELQTGIAEALREAVRSGDPACEAARRACALHKEWLTIFYDGYTPEYHAALGDMYVLDERFRAHYEEIAPGAAEMLRDAIRLFVKA
jgi:DNA-binding transcriptional MerR regulator